MSETVTTITANDEYRVVAVHDYDAESPRWGAEVGSMLCLTYRYSLGDEHVGVIADVIDQFRMNGTEGAIEWLKQEHGVTVILPLYLHDHSGLSMTAGANLLDGGTFDATDWDTGVVGVIFATAEAWSGAEILGDIEAVLRAEVKEYDAYLRGDTYVLHVERKAIRVTRVTDTYPDGEVKESVGSEVVWVPVPDGEVHATYGDEDHLTIAAEMLHEFEAPVSNTAAHSE